LDQRSSPARPGQVRKIIDIDIPAPRQLKKIGDDLAKYISQIRQALEGDNEPLHQGNPGHSPSGFFSGWAVD